MPASSFSGLNSWGLYLVSAAALVLLLSPHLSTLAADARESADWRNVDGVRQAVDSLRPGVSIIFALDSPLPLDPIRLAGRQVICDYGRGTLNLQTRWSLANATLLQGSRYVIWLEGGTVSVRLGG